MSDLSRIRDRIRIDRLGLLKMFVHRIDPIIASIGGVHLWWYGLSYTLAFLNLWWYLRRARHRLGLTLCHASSLTLCLAVGILAGGRAVEVAFDEWPFYRAHPFLIPAYWLGGMATHGLLLGAALGLAMFTRVCRKPFLKLADGLVIPGAFLLGVGRIGNFIDGQIVGAITDNPWAVQFPDAVGVRHPVVLYDGAKNLALIPYLLWVSKTNPTPGAVASRFVFWYAFPRILIDLLRDYPTHRLALGTGQTLNIAMATAGIVLLVRSRRRRQRCSTAQKDVPSSPAAAEGRASLGQSLAFATLLAFCLTIPSNWTQDVPGRYGKRHPGLKHSWMYPAIDTAPDTHRARCRIRLAELRLPAHAGR